jgi:hypothetical protein
MKKPDPGNSASYIFPLKYSITSSTDTKVILGILFGFRREKMQQKRRKKGGG